MGSNQTLISVRQEGELVCVTFCDDDLTLTEVPGVQVELERLIEPLASPKVVLNLASFRYLPTTALGVFVAILTKVLKKEGRLCLTGLRPDIMELFSIARLETIFEIHDDEEAALRSLDAG